MKFIVLVVTVVFAILVGMSVNPTAYGMMTYDEKVSSYQRLHEINSHIVASEENFEKGNTKMAMQHLSHPIEEVFDFLHFDKFHNNDYSQKLQLTLFLLRNTSMDIDVKQYTEQISTIREILDEGKEIISSDPEMNPIDLEIQSAVYLLDVAKLEYAHGLETNMPYDDNIEYQDSYAQSEMAERILKRLDSTHQKGDIFDKYFIALDTAYANSGTLKEIDSIIDKILSEIDSIDIAQRDTIETSELIPKDIPEWVKNIALWWATGDVNDGEFVQAIEFLINQGTIVVKSP